LAGVSVVGVITVSVLVIRGEEPPSPKQIRTTETATAGGVPSPSAAETRALLDGLRDIRADLATRRSVALAVDMCEEMLVGRDDMEENPEFIIESPALKEKARQRFGAERKVNKTQAGRILRLISGTFCRR
jgi:hypothetical protein